ncbi:MAG: winged helix-turn-helix domain-containing protein [Xanthomonadaceae bacterium]|nr:winged helix-turn-helix domain-containing protein [Xanthomonadaceae bacterium]
MEESTKPVAPDSPACWRFAHVRLDEFQARLWVHGRQTAIGRSELSLLSHLLRHAGEVVHKDVLLQVGWRGRIVAENTLAKTVSKLRHALGDEQGELLRVVHGYGYRLAAQVERIEPLAEAEPPPPRAGAAGSPFALANGRGMAAAGRRAGVAARHLRALAGRGPRGLQPGIGGAQFDRRAAVRRPQPEARPGLFRRRPGRGTARLPGPGEPVAGGVAHLVVRLARQQGGYARDRSPARCAPRAGRQRPQLRPARPRHRAADRRAQRVPPLVEDLRPPHRRAVRDAGRHRQPDRRGDADRTGARRRPRAGAARHPQPGSVSRVPVGARDLPGRRNRRTPFDAGLPAVGRT